MTVFTACVTPVKQLFCHQKSLLFITLFTMLFTACQESTTEVSTLSTPITLHTSIRARVDAQTRASFGHEGDGKGSFSSGDEISVYVTPQGKPTQRYTATYNGSQWTFSSPLTWSILGASKATFTAFYPAIDTPEGGTYTLTCETAQNFGGILERSDKLLLSTTTVSAGQPVALSFRHAMHYLEVNLSSQDPSVSQNALNMADIRINAYTEVGINTATGNFTAPRGQVKQIRMRSNNTSHFRAVVCPQPIQESWRTQGWLQITINSQTHQYNAPATFNNGTAFSTLASGQRVKLNLQIGKGNEIIEDLTNKTIWVKGLQNIPSQTTWGIAYQNMGNLGLQWQPYYGWYDIKKKDATTPAFDDHRMCWAAASTNMLHWWYDRNKENVACYIKYKQATDPTYVAPKIGYNSATHKESDIFEFFKRTTLNSSCWPVQGLRWYLRGDWFTNPGDVSSVEDNSESRQHQKQGGFFGEVYADLPISEIWQGRNSGYAAGTFIKEALQRGDVLGIDHQSMNGNHAITLWGAAFDDDGEVTTLYVCDNNHSDAELNQGGGIMTPGKIGPFGIFQMRIKRDSPDSEIHHLESSTKGSYNVEIAGLESLSQGEAAWARFWAKHPEYAPKQ